MRTFVLTMLVLLLMSAVAAAHTPIFLPDRPGGGVQVHRTVKDPERSWAIYGRLAPEAAADVVPMQAEKGQRLYVQLLVPDREELAGYLPRAVVVGPGLTGEPPDDLPGEVGAAPGDGALAVPPVEPSQPLYEGFTQMHYRVVGLLNTTFPESGTYHLVLYDPERRGGPYTAALGKKEVFGPLDVLTFPLVWARAHVWLWK